MKEKIDEFKAIWDNIYRHIDMVLTDKEIEDYISRHNSIISAVDSAVDYVVSQGLGEVQE